MQDIQTVKTVLPEECFGLAGSAPPVIVVAFKDDLLSRQFMDEPKILRRFLQTHAPAQIPAEDTHIVRLQVRKTLSDFFRMILPILAKHVHRLIQRKRQMEISDRIKCHIRFSSA